MHPRIELGPVTIYTYGLMLAIGIAVGICLLCLELRRKRIDPAHGIWIAVIAIPAGVVGARLLFIVEEWRRFVIDPVGVLFGLGGLSFYGGLLFAVLAFYPYLRWNGVGLLAFGDALAPGALLGRGIGRIGCHLSGDGDYGLPTTLPWGTDYSQGILPPSRAMAALPDLARSLPAGPALDHLPMHPTGVYEFLAAAIGFAVLWSYRTRVRPDGAMLMLVFVAMGAVRFGLEFLALAPVLAFGLTEAQLISLALIAIGVVGFVSLRIQPHAHPPDIPAARHPHLRRSP
jgi:phosphatidylglycerol:prolipoprotein diacylglycerol transferase